jgi:plasmid maintenance system antidote protein VapI
MLPEAEKERDLLPSIHLVDILLQDFTRPHLTSMNELAFAMCVPPTQLGAVIHGKTSHNGSHCSWARSFFGTTPELWLNLQRDYDLPLAETAKLAAID